ncbi:MAG: hypothetical protein LBM98_09865 [Oscillospiraceae bacterium]|nr:hypothetical protein [Oscillospiraceae bacterium]
MDGGCEVRPAGEPPRHGFAVPPLPRGEFTGGNPRRLRAAPPSPEGGFFGWTGLLVYASRAVRGVPNSPLGRGAA